MGVLLLSGGLDSVLLLRGHVPPKTLCVSVHYGQPTEEIVAAQQMTKRLGFDHQIVSVRGLYTDSSSGMFTENDEIASDTIVPCRNALLITIGAATGATEIYIGCNKDDQQDYPDCRPGFLESIGRSLGVAVRAPLIPYTKKQIVRMAHSMGISMDDIVSCYRGNNCGICFSCKILNDALA